LSNNQQQHHDFDTFKLKSKEQLILYLQA